MRKREIENSRIFDINTNRGREVPSHDQITKTCSNLQKSNIKKYNKEGRLGCEVILDELSSYKNK